MGGVDGRQRQDGMAYFKLHRVTLVPTVWKGKPIPVDIANELPMMLHFVFQESKRKVELDIGQLREGDFAQTLMRRFQSGEHRLLHIWRREAAREPLPTTTLYRLCVAFPRTDNAPKLTRNWVGWQIG